MAVHASISTSEIGDKARRELLQLLEGVISHLRAFSHCNSTDQELGQGEKEPRYRALARWAFGSVCQILNSAGVWSRPRLLS
jgi:hypothetical protein